MEFAIGVVISYLLVFLFAGSKASQIGRDETLTACYIEELPDELELQEPYDLQYCDHIIVYITPIMLLNTHIRGFFRNLNNFRKTNSNLKILGKIKIAPWKAVSNIEDTLNSITTSIYDFDGFSLYFRDKPSDFSDEWKSQSTLFFDTYRKKGKLVTLFINGYGFGNINDVYYPTEVDYIYVVCAIDYSFTISENLEDVTIRTVRLLINSGISSEQIVIAINFCPMKGDSGYSSSFEEANYDEVCKLFMGNHNEKNITSNEIINKYEWCNDNFMSQILFNSPETVANQVIRAKDLGLAGVMAYRLECDNTEPICLNKDGRSQLFNALRKTEENEAFDYPDCNYESGGKENALTWFIISFIFFLWILFL